MKVLNSTDFGPEGNIGKSILIVAGVAKLLMYSCADFTVVDAVVDATLRYHEIFYAKED